MTDKRRFDELATSYEELLKDPIRDRFSGDESLFFHQRKSELIRRFLRYRKMDPSSLRYLDVGCGKGELATLLKKDFLYTAVCDLSGEMMQHITEIEARIQETPTTVPFGDSEFDFVTAVCVYHHVPPALRPGLTAEIVRVLRPGGIFCMIEHNPLNPVTRLIVSRTPVDADAILLYAREARALVCQAGLRRLEQDYFLYFPQGAYSQIGRIEPLLSRIPLGGQYAVFSCRTRSTTSVGQCGQVDD